MVPGTGINRAIRTYSECMRDYKVESKFPPPVKEDPSLVEDHDRGVGAPVEYVDVVSLSTPTSATSIRGHFLGRLKKPSATPESWA